jgi:hypothetical protein
MIKIRFLDSTCTRRTWGIYRFGPDGLSVKSFPGEPEEYDPASEVSRERRKLLDRGVLTLMASAERRRRFELVHVDEAQEQSKAAPVASSAPTPPRAQREDDKTAKSKYDAEHPEEHESEREDAKPASPALPVVSMATGLPLPIPVQPKGKPQQPAPPTAKPVAPPKGKPAKG